jgi:hypothetical protein
MRTLLIRLAALLCSTLLSGCTGLFFHPHSYLMDTPEKHGLTYQSEFFQAADDVKLNAWFFPAQGKDGNKPRATILFLHGNAENISTHFRNIAWLPTEGYNVLALDYRGYGASDGVPTLTGMLADIDAAMGHLQTHKGVDPKRIVILGQSLGGPLAIYYTAHSPYRVGIRAAIIDSAFSDYRRIAREKLASSYLIWLFQWLPWVAVNNDYSPEDAIAKISPIPLLLIHGDRDAVVPSHHSQLLFDKAKEPKALWIVPGAGHIQSLNNEAVRSRLLEFLARYTGD